MIILGSQSPRRKEIMEFFNLPFIQISPDFDEESIPFTGDPKQFALTIAHGKGKSLVEKYPEAILLTADTVVYKDGKVFGKPVNKEHAKEMISELSGNWHSVYTAITLRHDQKVYDAIEETRVLFNALTSAHIDHYIDTLHFSDKAGGYAIQSAGGLIVRRIEGCYYNVMGLPINALYGLLHNVGIDLWKAIR